jgi:hypothetical protein
MVTVSLPQPAALDQIGVMQQAQTVGSSRLLVDKVHEAWQNAPSDARQIRSVKSQEPSDQAILVLVD